MSYFVAYHNGIGEVFDKTIQVNPLERAIDLSYFTGIG